jgi:uncharacterized HAD superfamily protein/hypoxanthine phosphoribosyltransferase
MEFRSINDLNKLINNNLHKLPKDIDLIVGVPRSGMLPATIVSLLLNLPLTDFENLKMKKLYTCGNSKSSKQWVKRVEDTRKILIVEDSTNTGLSIRNIKKELEDVTYKDKIIFLSLYVTKESQNIPDIFFEICSQPRMFEWNYLHHTELKNACFDIDGVLCRDPSDEENDDGEKYVEFISNVPCRVAPTRKIGTIVTSRLEKYRDITTEWLIKNNIEFDKLIMMQLETMEERKKLGNHGQFKAKCYSDIKSASIFIESEIVQAQEIAKITSKPVFCTQNQHFYSGRGIYSQKYVSKKYKIKKFIVKFKIVQIMKRLFKMEGK